MRSKKTNDLTEKEVYKRYLKDGVNSLSTKELLDLLDILYALGKNYEVIEVAEYTLSLIDMGISNDFIDEELNEWLDNSFEAEENTEEFQEGFPGEWDNEYQCADEGYQNNDEENIGEPNDENIDAEEFDEDRASDNLETLREYLLKLIMEASLREHDYDRIHPIIDQILETSDIREADLYNDIALMGMSVGDFMFALKYLKAIINDPIHKVAAINNLAACYEAMGELDKGIKLLQDYLDEDPYDNITWINLGNLLARNDNFDEALKAFDFAFAIDDTNMACLKNIAKVYKVKGNFTKAIKYLDDAEKLDPNDYEVHIIKAECYLIMNKPKKAAVLFNKVIKEFPDRPEIYHSLSVAYILDNQVEKAYRAAVKSWELAPDNHFFKSFMAKILGEDKGMRAQADKLYREILRDSDDPQIHMITAQYYLNANNPNKALQIALKVEEKQADVHHLHIFMSRCYAVLGKFDEAQKHFDLETDEKAKQEFYNTLNDAKSN